MRGLLLFSFLVIPFAMGIQATAAVASDGWCDTDPILVIRTPAGRLVPIYVDVGAQNVLFTPNTLLSSLVVSYTAVPTRNGAATTVTMVVTVPPSLLDQTFATRATASTGAFGSGTIYASASGISGQPMTSKFQLPYT